MLPPRKHRRSLASLVLVTGFLVAVLPAGTASAAISTSPTATDFAASIASDPGVVTGASWATVPSGGTPNAISDTPLTAFPRNGSSFGIMTSGDANLADDANTSGSSGAGDGGFDPARGATAFDISVLRIDVSVPSTADCLSIDFQFLSEEYPEYLNSQYNDAFIAEMDTSDWVATSSSISAPHNFAFDPSGNAISINSTGSTSMSAGSASGTTYDGATPVLSAQSPVSPGSHSLYLSIFDQGDAGYDSAAFLDNLVIGNAGPGGCAEGATLLPLAVTKDASDATRAPGQSVDYTIHVANPNATPVDLTSVIDDLPAGFAYQSGSTSGLSSADPSIGGQTLTWETTDGSVPAGGSIDLSFSATVSSETGDYYNNAAGTSADVPVTPSGDTALVMVAGGGSECAASVPSQPRNVQAFPGNASAALTWDPPADDGGAAIDAYSVHVHPSSGGGAPIHSAPVHTSTTVSGTTAKVDGLSNGSLYTFTVEATNCAGTGPESAPSNEVMPTSGSSAEVIGDGNLSQSTGTTRDPTPDDTTIGSQSFPAGTSGIGTLEELTPDQVLAVKGAAPVGQFCGSSTCIGNILQAELHNGTLGPNPKGGISFYKLKLLLDRSIVQRAGTDFQVWYDGNLEDDGTAGGDPTPPSLLAACRRPYTGTPCVIKIRRTPDFDLKILVKSSDLDPRLSTSR